MKLQGLTVHNDPSIDAALSKELELIRDHVQDLLGDLLDAILLGGGFGRGEGGVVMVDGKPKVANDYDLLILLKGRVFPLTYRRYAPRLKKLAEELGDKLGIKQVDFGIRNRGMIESGTEASVSYYELMAGHKLLAGDPIRPPLSDWESFAASLPKTEGTVYFINRGSGLLISALYLQPDGSIREENRDNFGIEIDKAIMAVGDAELIRRGQYTLSYRERLRRFDSLEGDLLVEAGEIKQLYREAVERKLDPTKNRLQFDDPAGWYNSVLKLFSDYFLAFESERLGVPYRDWQEYSSAIGSIWGKSWKRYVQGIVLVPNLFSLLTPSFWKLLVHRQQHRLVEVLPLLLFANLQEDRVRAAWLLKAASNLGVKTGKRSRSNWNILTRKYLSYYHPEGEAGKLARGDSEAEGVEKA